MALLVLKETLETLEKKESPEKQGYQEEKVKWGFKDFAEIRVIQEIWAHQGNPDCPALLVL